MERYLSHIQIPTIGEEGQKKLLQSKVLICGAGGLGSTVIANLASLGIGTIGIVDDDELVLSDYNKEYIHKYKNLGCPKALSAKQWTNEYNPDIEVRTYFTTFDNMNYVDICGPYDLIVDCFDSYKSKFLLNKISFNMGKILIHGGVSEFCGQVMVIDPRKSACLSCLFPNYEKFEYIPKGVVSPTVSVIASLQAMEVLKYIINTGTLLKGQLLTYNALNCEFKKINIPKNEKCELCAN